VREKDGLWAVLFWLNLIASRERSVEEIVRAHWSEYGRDYFSRHDYYIEDPAVAQELMTRLREVAARIRGIACGGLTIESADDFSYTDPVDGSVSARQGVRVFLTDGSRIVYRLSGTGTGGATLRVYLERHIADVNQHGGNSQGVLAGVAAASREIARIEERTGLARPTAVI
jgi:phosphoglucomutase